MVGPVAVEPSSPSIDGTVKSCMMFSLGGGTTWKVK